MTQQHLAPETAGTVFDDDTAQGARTYAEALVNAAANDGDGQVDAALDDLDGIVSDVIRAHPRFADLLASTSIRAAEKDRVLVETFEGRALPTVVRFLRVLNQHGRLELLAQIAQQARLIWDRRQNRRPVTVRSAVPMDEGQQNALRDRLAGLTGGTPIMRMEVDPSLIGGLVVQVGDDVYDASVRNRLAQMRKQIIEGRTRDIQSRGDSFSSLS